MKEKLFWTTIIKLAIFVGVLGMIFRYLVWPLQKVWELRLAKKNHMIEECSSSPREACEKAEISSVGNITGTTYLVIANPGELLVKMETQRRNSPVLTENSN